MSAKKVFFKARVQTLLLLTAGQMPTVPAVPTTTPLDDAWVDATDIMIGEFAVNVVDNKVFTRTSGGIVEVGSGGSAEGAMIFKGEWDANIAPLPNVAGIKKGWWWIYRLIDPNTPAVFGGGKEVNDGAMFMATVDDADNIDEFYYKN